MRDPQRIADWTLAEFLPVHPPDAKGLCYSGALASFAPGKEVSWHGPNQRHGGAWDGVLAWLVLLSDVAMV